MRVGRPLVILLAACGPAIPPLPSVGGPAWLEVRTEHFTLWTDAGAERGRELVSEMEHRREVIMAAMSRAPAKARAFVVALRNQRETDVYLPKQAIAVAWDAQNPTAQPGILLAANTDDREHVVNHELTHVISFGLIHNQPHWLAEGIATYFEMADLDPHETSIQLGIPREDRTGILREIPPRATDKLFSCQEPDCMDPLFYATSWALFSYLLNERSDQLARYLGALNNVRFGEHAKAWQAVFPDVPSDQLDRDLLAWLHAGKARLPRVKVTGHELPRRPSACSTTPTCLQSAAC